MGATSYRFSISWARILPQGTGVENPAGIQYYKNLLAALESRGITPAVTLYHWDLPQALEDQGGWLNADIALWFEEYARVCFREFGDKVRRISSLENLPNLFKLCDVGQVLDNLERAMGAICSWLW